MNGYSKQESEKAMSEMVNLDCPISSLIAKIKPKNFEYIEDRPVSASCVDKIMERFISEFNDKFVPNLNSEFQRCREDFMNIQDEIGKLEIIDHNNVEWEESTHSDLF